MKDVDKKNKVLIISNVITMINQFNMNNIDILQSMGYEIHVACNLRETSFSPIEVIDKYKGQLEKKGIIVHQVDFGRRFAAYKTLPKCIEQISEILKTGGFKFVHCHSQVACLCGRIAARRNDVKSICSIHGFMFYKGAPKKYWALFFPIEAVQARYTDVLILTNKEDYNTARRYFRPRKIYYVPGVGVDVDRLDNTHIDRDNFRQELGLKPNEKMILSAGELSTRKNHEVVIRALSKINNNSYKYYICGQGDKEAYLKNLASELHVKDQVIFLGFRTDLDKLYKASDLFVHPSIQEGLSVVLMEALASRIPTLCSQIRGNTDLITDERCLF